MSKTYPIGIRINNRYFVLHSIYEGDYFRPSGPWYDNADLVTNLTDNSIMLLRKPGHVVRRKKYELTKVEQRAFRQAKDVTRYRDNAAFFTQQRNKK